MPVCQHPRCPRHTSPTTSMIPAARTSPSTLGKYLVSVFSPTSLPPARSMFLCPLPLPMTLHYTALESPFHHMRLISESNDLAIQFLCLPASAAVERFTILLVFLDLGFEPSSS
ncbi:hypothetical protein BCV70DRAFT_20438 [Testicularia cyperi]|uniref:Uncharacterized protein n=1 Tax=Testicularia cyperi TaxID=1882483 RepID=A0A317XZB3_9BASI|nr:hypothetical protein BCV70DRAFT_20438 [Testicularia cyperi]